jgi:hypothetical protein
MPPIKFKKVVSYQIKILRLLTGGRVGLAISDVLRSHSEDG